MFNIFKKKTPGNLIVTLNAKLQPMHRAELEDAFDEFCNKKGVNAGVIGGGTHMDNNGEVKACDIEIQTDDLSDENLNNIASIFEMMLAPIGSRIQVTGQNPLPFGKHQGLGLYLNGTDLPDEVYERCDSNYIYAECERLLEGIAMVNSYWQGPTESALYMYGADYLAMERAIKPLIDSYPLCQKARIVRIA